MSEAASSSQLDSAATVTTVPVSAKRTVTYEFDTRATNADLAIPYVVIVNGKVPAPDKPRKLGRDNRLIKATVDAGSKVALYLNSDVHPDHRCSPVYEVKVGDHDVLVKITEEIGNKNGDKRPIVEPAPLKPTTKAGAAPLDCYQAALTGRIWMLISHRYTAAEADYLLPQDIEPTIRKAICSIYQGLAWAKLKVPLATTHSDSSKSLIVNFEESGNPQDNIANCSTLNDVLPRTHPHAFAVLISEACKLGVTNMLITSNWRPSFGSIVHRAGLGLDVAYIADATHEIKINRTGLKNRGPSSNPNVTDKEKALYEAYMAIKEKVRPKKSSSSKAGVDENGEREKLQEELDAAEDAWERERNRNEPALIHDLRDKLSKHRFSKQIFDPWYMELNTHSSAGKTSNEQRSKNETIHVNHLHLTISEPKIYE